MIAVRIRVALPQRLGHLLPWSPKPTEPYFSLRTIGAVSVGSPVGVYVRVEESDVPGNLPLLSRRSPASSRVRGRHVVGRLTFDTRDICAHACEEYYVNQSTERNTHAQ